MIAGSGLEVPSWLLAGDGLLAGWEAEPPLRASRCGGGIVCPHFPALLGLRGQQLGCGAAQVAMRGEAAEAGRLQLGPRRQATAGAQSSPPATEPSLRALKRPQEGASPVVQGSPTSGEGHWVHSCWMA